METEGEPQEIAGETREERIGESKDRGVTNKPVFHYTSKVRTEKRPQGLRIRVTNVALWYSIWVPHLGPQKKKNKLKNLQITCDWPWKEQLQEDMSTDGQSCHSTFQELMSTCFLHTLADKMQIPNS